MPSGRKVDIVKELFDAFNRRDVRAALALMYPEVSFFAPETGTANKREYHFYPGHEGILLYFHDVARTWEELLVIPDTFHESHRHVVALGRVRARPKGGPPAEAPTAWVWRFQDGKVVHGSVYADATAALEAAGLSAE